MKTVIALVGVAICLAGLIILITPEKFRNIMNRFAGQPRFLFAVIARILIGAILLYEAANLRFMLAMQIIGGISILAAVVLLLMGLGRMDRMIDWFMSKMADNVMRVWSVFAIDFGAFLVYVKF